MESTPAERDLISVAKKAGATSVGISVGEREIPRRFFGRLFGLPRKFTPVFVLGVHSVRPLDAAAFNTDLNAVTLKHGIAVEWHLLKLAYLDPRAAKAVKLLPK